MHPNQITDWKARLVQRASRVFGSDTLADPKKDLKELPAKVGQTGAANVVGSPLSGDVKRPGRP